MGFIRANAAVSARLHAWTTRSRSAAEALKKTLLEFLKLRLGCRGRRVQPRARKVNIDDKVHTSVENSAAIFISLRGSTAYVMANKIQVVYHYQVPAPGIWYWYDTRYQTSL